MTARLIESGPDQWHVFDDNDISYLNYIGLIQQVGDRWRVHGTRIGIDYRLVDMERDFGNRDEAVEWLLDEDES